MKIQNDDVRRLKKTKIMFFLILLLTIVPLFLFPVKSYFIKQFYKIPEIQNQVLDLSGYVFDRHQSVPLDGEWEFFWEKWIVSDSLPEAEPDLMASVPSSWTKYRLNGESLPAQGYGSYRLHLKNFPKNAKITVSVPNTHIAYRVFLDGELIAVTGTMSKEPFRVETGEFLQRDWLFTLPQSDCELVIEVSSSQIGGLYAAPVLAEDTNAHFHSKLNTIVISIYIGILLVVITSYAYVLIRGDHSICSIALLLLDILIFLRILVKDELLGSLQPLFPFLSSIKLLSVLELLTFFMPAVFLFSTKTQLGLPLSRKEINIVMIFELICIIPLFYCMINGFMEMQFLFCLMSFLPFIPALNKLYKLIKQDYPYALTVSIELLFLLSGLIIGNIYNSGLLLINVSLYPATCFVIVVLVQDYIYIHKSSMLNQEVYESAKLRLQLKESETALMLSQIKPHFLYNALTAIQVLCTREPETAEQAIGQFSKYLRANMASINSQTPIPFEQELEHIRNYAAIEQLRFQEKLSMEYDIKVKDFLVPPLTIQPLIENAIKHGACKKITGGKVILKTWESENEIYIEVADSGVGFDVSLLENEQKNSYGLKNIRFRLEHILNSTISIVSKPEIGTRVLVTIPKRGRLDESHHSG